MSYSYHSGVDGLATVGGTPIAISKWDCNVKGNAQDVSNTINGRKRIGGLLDAEGSMMLHWDSDNEPTTIASPNIRHNSILTVKFITDGGTNGFQMSVIVDECHVTSEIEGTIDFDVKYALEDGTTFVYPT